MTREKQVTREVQVFGDAVKRTMQPAGDSPGLCGSDIDSAGKVEVMLKRKAFVLNNKKEKLGDSH